MPKAAFSRLCGVSKQAVAKWVSRGIAMLAANDEIHLEATAAAMRSFRVAGLPPGFQAFLDGTPPGAEASAPVADGRRPTARSHAPPRTAPATIRFRRAELVERLRALDWQAPWALDEERERSRAAAAAVAVGYELAESDESDDGHWGGYQLRSLERMTAQGWPSFEAVVAGYGYELEAWDVLQACREVISHPDDVEGDGEDLIPFDLVLLQELAYPFGPDHLQPEAPAGDLR
jgi:hypothetical protein